jgi:hypothetical protein
MSARRWDRSGQVSAWSVITVPFESDVSVGNKAYIIHTSTFGV